ncbi:MAG TPA: BMP family protein, partial [Salinarimonas sp.]|nr:BMP family protein [Salinarimonas sp.]
MSGVGFNRRSFMGLGLGAVGTALLPAGAFAQGKPKPIKVAAIYTVPVEQQWVSRIHKALNAAQARGDVTYKFSENVANNDYERIMRQYSEEGSDLVVGEIFGVERAARRVASNYPKVAYLMGSSFGPAKPNMAVFDNWIQEPAYLTGMVAGKATKSNLIGMVGGYAIPEVNRLMHAFMDGARAVNPNVRFLVTFINSWYDPPKAKEAAFAMIDKGADVMYAERF